jgi:cation diffusion facilitator family transporter
MPSISSSKLVVYAALGGNLMVALIKFAAAALTGSSAMLSEAVHSLVDTGNQGLLLYGMHRAARPPDENHPLGHGRELYFWSFVVALLLFMLGAGVTFYEGIDHIIHRPEIVSPLINYAVLGFSALFEGTSWIVALREFRKAKGEQGYLEAVRRSKDPPTFIVLFEDSAALTGLAIAFAGTYSADILDMPILDGIASVGISLVLALTAITLAREAKGLLLGEPARAEVVASILKIAQSTVGIERARVTLTVHLAPDQIVVALSLEFADNLTTPQIEDKVLDIERAIRKAHPEVLAVFVKPQTAASFRAARERLMSAK